VVHRAAWVLPDAWARPLGAWAPRVELEHAPREALGHLLDAELPLLQGASQQAHPLEPNLGLLVEQEDASVAERELTQAHRV